MHFWLRLSVFPDLIQKIQMPIDKLKWEHNALKDYLWDVDIQIWTSHLHFILTMQQNTVPRPTTRQLQGNSLGLALRCSVLLCNICLFHRKEICGYRSTGFKHFLKPRCWCILKRTASVGNRTVTRLIMTGSVGLLFFNFNSQLRLTIAERKFPSFLPEQQNI